MSWNMVNLAQTYLLQEDDNTAFSSPTTRYDGSGTSWSANGKAAGTYYYRVKARHTWGDSDWSNVQSVSVGQPLPDTPVLNPISNSDDDGNYAVSWSAVGLAETYILQEDDNAAFSSPATRYDGSGTSWNASGKAAGTYYYRVQARNSGGDSSWSNVQSVTVQPQTGPTPGLWEDTGLEFYVTTDGAYVDDFAIYISVQGCGNYKITHTSPEPITNDQFSFSGSFYASGTFDSATTASGTTGLDHFHIPGCGTISGGPLSWNATWQNSSQPTVASGETVELEIVEPITATNQFYTVSPIK